MEKECGDSVAVAGLSWASEVAGSSSRWAMRRALVKGAESCASESGAAVVHPLAEPTATEVVTEGASCIGAPMATEAPNVQDTIAMTTSVRARWRHRPLVRPII